MIVNNLLYLYISYCPFIWVTTTRISIQKQIYLVCVYGMFMWMCLGLQEICDWWRFTCIHSMNIFIKKIFLNACLVYASGGDIRMDRLRQSISIELNKFQPIKQWVIFWKFWKCLYFFFLQYNRISSRSRMKINIILGSRLNLPKTNFSK